MTVSLLTSGAAGANPPERTISTDREVVAAPPADGSRSVTLVTGDRVTVTGDGGVVVHRGDGREHVTFLTQRLDDHQYVIPSDAMSLLAAGRLDRRLFDVTLLREFGYHDARGDLPLIVTHDGAAAPSAVTDAAAGEVRSLPAIDGASVQIDHSETGTFWGSVTGGRDTASPRTFAAGLSTVWLDGLRQPSLDQSVPQVGAPAAWEVGLDGTGVIVAVLDTGIDAEHPDLADRVVGQQNFTEGEEDDRDLVGHGTHVASTVAGTGAASEGQYVGVAPGAQLLDGKVCTEFGCAESWLLAGMEWAAEQGADVVNMSLGGPDQPGLDPVEQAVETLTEEHGVLFVIAAGNDGADASVSSPASTDAALAVGAVDKADELAAFSSRGPRIDGALKPDLTAPGVEIVAANSQDGFLGEPGESYTTISGTSMATPHVAGAAAILSQQHPDWSPEQIKTTLMASAAPHPDLGPAAQGAGRLDVARAITLPVTTSPASVSFDRLPWPHGDDEPETRTISYTNHGDTDLVLDLAVTALGPDGEPAPDGTFAADAGTVTVPAGGTAEVSLSSDTTVPDVDGYFGGYVTATSGEVAVRTPFGVDREVESYDLTLAHTDRDGAPTSNYDTVIFGLDPFGIFFAFGEPEVAVRLPAGEYFVASFLWEDEEFTELSMLVQPGLRLDGDQRLAVEASSGEPVSIGVPDPNAVLEAEIVDATRTAGEITVGAGLVSGGTEDLYTAQLGPAEPVPGVTTMVGGTLAVPSSNGDIAASRTAYHLAWFVADEFPTGFERTAERRDLARVRGDHARQVEGSEAAKGAVALTADGAGGIGVGIPIELPLTRTEYLHVDDGVRWLSFFDELVFSDEAIEEVILLDSEPTSYRPGRSYRERWNYGAFGPVLVSGFSGVLRAGDELLVVPDLYGDGAGHWGWAPSGGTIRVLRDGELIVEEPTTSFAQVEVPPEPAGYRVEVEAERIGPAPLSTQTSLAWEFESGHVDGEAEVPLPVSVVRFSPSLRPDNTAPAGRRFLVPVSVDPAPGSDAGEVSSLSVEVSFDDGQTWREARVVGGRFVVVSHPEEPGFVSLRAAATDTEGNVVEQTVIRAYEIT